MTRWTMKAIPGMAQSLFMLSVLVFTMTFCLASTAHGEIYRWQDEEGHWHFTDSPTSDDKGARPDNPSPEPAPTAPAAVAPAAVTPTAVTTNPGQPGLLWKISKDGQKPSYLLGTIHSTDPRVTQLRSAVSNALDASDRFVMEMNLDASAIMQFGASMMIANGEDLETILGHDLFTRAVAAMDGFGMPELVVRQLKPWVVMAILSMPPSSGGMILDLVLRQRATSQGKPATGLETAQEQLAVFEGLSRQDQIELLENTLDQMPAQAGLFEELIQAYAADDLDRIAGIARQSNANHASAAALRFMQRLNDERNLRMARRILPYLEQSNSFIAVGALHLPGKEGLLSLLRQQGYRTEPVP